MRFLLPSLLAASLAAQGPYEPRVGPWLQAPAPGSLVVMWETTKECRGAVELDSAGVATRTFHEDHDRTIHEVQLVGLGAGTRYRYRVRSDEGMSPSYELVGPPAAGQKKVKVGVYGDTRTNPDVHARTAALLLKEEPDLVVHTGDFVLTGPAKDQWRTMFFLPAKELVRRVPVLTVLGNHERHHPNYSRYFCLPGERQRGTDHWWSCDFGPLHLIGLDSDDAGDPKGDEGKWLTQELARDTPSLWRIATFHHPLYSAHPTRAVNDSRGWWQEPFQKAGIDLVWAGHDHHYQRTWPIGSLLDAGAHTILHTTNGGGGAPLYPVYEYPWTAKTESVHAVSIWSFDGDSARVKVLREDGSLLESYDVERRRKTPIDEVVAIEVVGFESELKAASAKRDPVPVREGPFEAKVQIEVPGLLPQAMSIAPRWSGGQGWELPALAPFLLPAERSKMLELVLRSRWPECYPLPELTLELSTPGGKVPCKNWRVVLDPVMVWPQRELELGKLPHLPSLDGKDDEWGNVAWADRFVARDGRSLWPLATRARVATAQDLICVYAEIVARDEKVFAKAEAKADEFDLLREEEHFIVAFGVDQDACAVAVSTNGTLFDMRNADKKWQSGARAVVRKDGTKWFVELVLPRKSLGGAPSRVEFTQMDGMTARAGEWVPTFGKPADVKRYGALVVR